MSATVGRQWCDRTRSPAIVSANGNIRGRSRRLLPIAATISANQGSGNGIEGAKSRHFRPILAFPGEPGSTPEWLAGAGGIEPPNGGIKIHCLTAWLRPNRPLRKARDDRHAVLSGNVGLQRESCRFNRQSSGFWLESGQATRIPAPVAIRPFILGILPRPAAAEPRIGTVCIPGAPEYRALTLSTNAPPPLFVPLLPPATPFPPPGELREPRFRENTAALFRFRSEIRS
jgi:hypothetical protein